MLIPGSNQQYSCIDSSFIPQSIMKTYSLKASAHPTTNALSKPLSLLQKGFLGVLSLLIPALIATGCAKDPIAKKYSSSLAGRTYVAYGSDFHPQDSNIPLAARIMAITFYNGGLCYTEVNVTPDTPDYYPLGIFATYEYTDGKLSMSSPLISAFLSQGEEKITLTIDYDARADRMTLGFTSHNQEEAPGTISLKREDRNPFMGTSWYTQLNIPTVVDGTIYLTSYGTGTLQPLFIVGKGMTIDEMSAQNLRPGDAVQIFPAAVYAQGERLYMRLLDLVLQGSYKEGDQELRIKPQDTEVFPMPITFIGKRMNQSTKGIEGSLWFEKPTAANADIKGYFFGAEGKAYVFYHPYQHMFKILGEYLITHPETMLRAQDANENDAQNQEILDVMRAKVISYSQNGDRVTLSGEGEDATLQVSWRSGVAERGSSVLVRM